MTNQSSHSSNMQRHPSAALAQQQSMHSMLRTSSGAGAFDETGSEAQGKRPGVRRQGSLGVPLESQDSLQSMLTPIQGMIQLCLVSCCCLNLQHILVVVRSGAQLSPGTGFVYMQTHCFAVTDVCQKLRSFITFTRHSLLEC